MALRAALAMEPDAIFLLTDGGDPHPDTVVQKNIHKLAQGRTAIHCIQFGSGPLSEDDGFLGRFAQRNGGGWTYVDLSRRGRS